MTSRLTWWLPLWLVVAACAPLLPAPEATDNVTRHALRPVSLPEPVAAVPGSASLAVLPVRPGPLIDDRGMVYVDGEGRRGTFVRNAWAAPPDQQLAEWLTVALERAGGNAAVIAPGGRGHAELLLESELLRFELGTDPSPGALRVELRLQLLTARDREVLATARLRETEPLDAPGPTAMAGAANRALTRLLASSARFVHDAVRPRAREMPRE